MTKKCICWNCGTIIESNDPQIVMCDVCGFTISKRKYSKRIEVGREIVYYGILYRDGYERILAKRGKLDVRFLLPWPSDILAFLGQSIAAAIVGDIAVKSVKKVFRKLYRQLKTMNLRSVDSRARRPWMRKDDLLTVSQLFADDDQFINDYYAKVYDFLNGMKNADERVKRAIIDEEKIEQIKIKAIEASRIDEQTTAVIPHRFVLVSRSGKCYHRNGCPRLSANHRRLLFEEAKKSYRSCKFCNVQEV
jgi:hypothetical protein